MDTMHRLCVFCTPFGQMRGIYSHKTTLCCYNALSSQFSLSEGFCLIRKVGTQSLGLRRCAHVEAEKGSFLVRAFHSYFFKKENPKPNKETPPQTKQNPKYIHCRRLIRKNNPQFLLSSLQQIHVSA